MSIGSWIYNVLIGLDQFANAIAGGSADETISSRSGRKIGIVSKFLNLFEKDHSLKAVEWTPWGTCDPHTLDVVNQEIASDWNAAIAVITSERDLDAWPTATKDAANRALLRLKAWEEIGGRARWVARMERDLDVGDRLAGGDASWTRRSN